MGTFLFRFYDDTNKIIKEVSGLIDGTKLIINNQFVEEILISASLSTDITKYWDIFLDCNNIFVIIENYNISSQLSLHNFDNTNSTISLFKADDVNLHVVGFDIKQASINNSEIFIANCTIEEMNVDLANFITFINEDYIVNCVEKFELRNTNVDKLGIYSSVKALVFSDSSIKLVESFSSAERVLEIDNLFVINSSLNSVMMNFKIEWLKIQDSKIYTLKLVLNQE